MGNNINSTANDLIKQSTPQSEISTAFEELRGAISRNEDFSMDLGMMIDPVLRREPVKDIDSVRPEGHTAISDALIECAYRINMVNERLHDYVKRVEL